MPVKFTPNGVNLGNAHKTAVAHVSCILKEEIQNAKNEAHHTYRDIWDT